MSILRIALNSFTLTLIDIAAVVAGFILWTLLPGANQLVVQIPAAAALVVAGFLLWNGIARHRFSACALRDRPEYAKAYLAALLWNPLLFTLVHYLTQGYPTGFGNIFGLAYFQLPVNFIAIQAALSTSSPPDGSS